MFFGAMMVVGCLLMQTERGQYLGLITVWAMPVLALQWGFGAEALMAQKSSWGKPLVYSWLYLCIIDRWAIRNGCWSISPKKTVPQIDWLPFEEAYFFLCTATMCMWGLQLAMNVSVLDCPLPVAFRRVIFWCRKMSSRLESSPWTSLQKHTLTAVGISVLVILFASDMSMKTQVIVLVFTTAIFGLPHGALDMIVADWLQIKNSNFLQLYLATMVGVVLAWFTVPRVALTLFVFKSVYHFGEGFTAGNPASHPIDILAWGGMLLIPIKVHAADVATIFSHLVGGLSLDPVLSVLNWTVQLHTVALILSLTYHILRSHKFEDLLILLECTTLFVVFYTMSPLIAFVIYFNIFHSARHLIRLGEAGLAKSAGLNSKPGNAMHSKALITFAVTVITVIALVACAVADMYQKMPAPGLHFQPEVIGPALRAVFIGLSALTVPHMIVVSALLKLPPLRRLAEL
jgi:Brp/Blh family beta-carotene 15,15'-monooxygenase